MSDECNHVKVYMPHSSEILYAENMYDLDTLVNTRPDGYITRVTYYAQGANDSQILLTPTNVYKIQSDPVYEFRN